MFDMFGKNNSEFFNEFFNPKWDTKVETFYKKSIYLVVKHDDEYHYFRNPEKYIKDGNTWYFGNPLLEVDDDKIGSVNSKVIHFKAVDVYERFYKSDQFISSFERYKKSQEKKGEK